MPRCDPNAVILALLSAWLLPCLTASADGDALAFDASKYARRTLAVGDQTVACRAYENLVYVSKPVNAQCQSINLYVPAAYYEGKSVGGYNAETAPIFLPNMIGGYMPAAPGGPGLDRDGNPNAIAVALARGYVVASPGARGWTLQGQSGLNTGKAPACIVDLKAAVRYLRHNDRTIPGNAERIISNGTSAGGALSALLGATGNSPDYEPLLKTIGAAEERDDIHAASCYCPITNLDNADAAYEWMFSGVNEYNTRGGRGTMTAVQVGVSDQLKRLFPPYLNGLHLKAPDGTALSLDEDGNGPFKESVKALVMAAARRAMDSGTDLSGLKWLTTEGRVVTGMDFAQFARYATRAKVAPAFDSLDLRTPENGLFGTATVTRQHFTQFGKEHSADGSLANAGVVKMMNPMNYIGTEGTRTAPHWRVRHGVIDRDTSLAVPLILATRLRNTGAAVDFALPWGVGHSGDYDLPELFAWVDGICR